MLNPVYGLVLLCSMQFVTEFDVKANGRADELFDGFTAIYENDETVVLKNNSSGP